MAGSPPGDGDLRWRQARLGMATSTGGKPAWGGGTCSPGFDPWQPTVLGWETDTNRTSLPPLSYSSPIEWARMPPGRRPDGAQTAPGRRRPGFWPPGIEPGGLLCSVTPARCALRAAKIYPQFLLFFGALRAPKLRGGYPGIGKLRRRRKEKYRIPFGAIKCPRV